MDIKKLIEVNDLLIKKIAHKFSNVSFEDLYQVGVIGLIKAAKNYHDDKTVKFSTYAYKYIFGEMYLYAMDSKNIKVTKNVLKMYKLIETTRYQLTQNYNRLPSDREIIDKLNITYDEYLAVITSVNDTISLDSLQFGVTEGYNYILDDTYKYQDDLIDLKEQLGKLDTLSSRLIKYRYYLDYTQSETAAKLGVSQVSVSRLEKKLIKKLHNDITI